MSGSQGREEHAIARHGEVSDAEVVRVEDSLDGDASFAVPDYYHGVGTGVGGGDPLFVGGDAGGGYGVAVALEELLGLGGVVVDHASVGSAACGGLAQGFEVHIHRK